MLDERIAVRAYFHWQNQTGRCPNSHLSNWRDALDDEEFLAGLPGSRRWPHTVIDQNMLQNAGVFATSEGPYLLPDVGPAEFLKDSTWRQFVGRTLANLIQRPESVHVAYSVGDVLRHEMASGELGELVDPVSTSGFQRFLKKVSTGATEAFDEYAATIEDGRNLARTQHFDVERNKQTVINARNGWLAELPESDLKTLRQPGGFESDLTHRLLSDVQMLATVALMLKNADYDERTANNLAFFPSLTAAHCLGIMTLALQWISRGGLDAGTKGEILTNDLLDLDYVVASVFCRRYLSADKKMVTLRGVLDRALRSLWTSNAEHILAATKKDGQGAV